MGLENTGFPNSNILFFLTFFFFIMATTYDLHEKNTLNCNHTNTKNEKVDLITKIKTNYRNVLKAIALGQLLSFLICGTAVTSGLLGQEGVNIPTAQSFLNYFLLCLFYTSYLACLPGEQNLWPILKDRGWKYFLLAVIDVEANYLVVKAYHYTTVTSVQLLDCFIIPTVMVLSWLVLKVRFRLSHIIGIFLCLAGVGALVGADVILDRYKGEGTNKLLGDILCLAGAMLYGISNVGQEFVVRNYNNFEFLGMIGMFGSAISGIQLAVLERQELIIINWQEYRIILPMIGFTICLFTMYSCMPHILKITSATAVNLNLLSADFYALLFGLFLFHYKFHPLYFVSFVLVIFGIIVYSYQPPHVTTNQHIEYSEMPTDVAVGTGGSPVIELLDSGTYRHYPYLENGVTVESEVHSKQKCKKPIDNKCNDKNDINVSIGKLNDA